MACSFQVTIDGKFAPLIGLRDEDIDINTMMTIYKIHVAVTDAANKRFGKERRRKSCWSPEMFSRRDLKNKLYEAEEAEEYREANKRIQDAVKKLKEDWVGTQCEEIDTCLNKNSSKREYQLVKDLS